MFKWLVIFIILITPVPALAQITALAEDQAFLIEFYWTHSGEGMDKFIIQYSTVPGGPYGNDTVLMIADLTQNEEGVWTGDITIDVPDDVLILYFVIFAQTSYGLNSALSNEAIADLRFVPGTPQDFVIKVTFT